jgi:hypothetical protein
MTTVVNHRRNKFYNIWHTSERSSLFPGSVSNEKKSFYDSVTRLLEWNDLAFFRFLFPDDGHLKQTCRVKQGSLLKGKAQYPSPPLLTVLDQFLLILTTLFTLLQNKLPQRGGKLY